MIFHTQHIKHGSKQVKIESISIDRRNIIEAFQEAQLKFPDKKILSYVDDKWNEDASEYEKVIVFYYEVPESDKDFDKRQNNAWYEDIKGVFDVISNYEQVSKSKDLIKKIIENLKLVGRYNFADFQKELLERFLSEDSKEQMYLKGLEVGRKQGAEKAEKELRAFAEKVKSLID